MATQVPSREEEARGSGNCKEDREEGTVFEIFSVVTLEVDLIRNKKHVAVPEQM